MGVLASPAAALEKQGSAHGGEVAGSETGFHFTGALTLGTSIINNSYAARPDNTGLALMRYAGHADVDLIGRRLSIPIDINLFTDRLRPGIEKLAPTEFDVITGVSSTWRLGHFGASETGVRIEHDRALDVAGPTQTYLDVRERYLYSVAEVFPGVADALRDGDVSGWLVLGWFAWNPTYFARPDNSGRALFRYGVNVRMSTFSDLFSVAIDATMFTDRHAPVPVQPSELDVTPEVIFHRGSWEVHLAFESDRTIDGMGFNPHFKQQFLYALLVWNFAFRGPQPGPFEERSHVPSP